MEVELQLLLRTLLCCLYIPSDSFRFSIGNSGGGVGDRDWLRLLLQVTRVINSLRPDNVVVELCRSRFATLAFFLQSDSARGNWCVLRRSTWDAFNSPRVDDALCFGAAAAVWRLLLSFYCRAGIMYDEAPSSSNTKQARTWPNTRNLMSMSGDSFASAMGRSLKLGEFSNPTKYFLMPCVWLSLGERGTSRPPWCSELSISWGTLTFNLQNRELHHRSC